MPLNSTQLAELVSRARSKPPPCGTTSRAIPSGRTIASANRTTAPKTGALTPQPARRCCAPCPIAAPAPAAADHRGPGLPLRLGAQEGILALPPPVLSPCFRRPMHRGEYSYLLHQIRGGHAEQLAEGCWQVTLPDRRRTLMIRATSWRLITILPKGWQPPGPPPVTVGASSPPYADPAAAAAVSAASSPR